MAQADAERGDRIKWLREEKLHLTQEAMADKIGVTLRGYQEWEAGGGIKWDNAKKLAKAAGVTPDWIMSGDRRETPDLSKEGRSQLDRMEAELAATRVDIGTLATQLEDLQRLTAQIAKTVGATTRSRKAN